MLRWLSLVAATSLCAACGARSELDAARPAPKDAGLEAVTAPDPDAYEVALVRTRVTRSATILLWHSATQQVSQLATLPPLGYDGVPALTFDGRFIAVELFVNDALELRILNADGTVARSQSFASPVSWLQPSLRPDGQRVLLEDGTSDIETLDADGTRTPILSTSAQNFLRNASYAPDGKTIVGTRVVGLREEIDLLHDDGTPPTVLVPLAGDEVELHDPAFGFDGRTLVYSRTAPHSVAIELLDLTTHETKTFPLGLSAPDPWPHVTPDGAGIVFVTWSDSTLELRRIEIATGAVSTLWSEPVAGEIVFDGISIAREPTN